jgi:hypothetical protein
MFDTGQGSMNKDHKPSPSTPPPPGGPLGRGSSDLQPLETDSDASDDSSDLEIDPHIAVSSMEKEVLDIHFNEVDHVELYARISSMKEEVAAHQKLLKSRQFIFDQKKQQLDAAQIQIVLKGDPTCPKSPIVTGSEPWAPESPKGKPSNKRNGISKQLIQEVSAAKKILKNEKHKIRSLNRILGHFTREYERKKHIADSRFSEISRGVPHHVMIERVGLTNNATPNVPFATAATVNNTDLQQKVSFGPARDQNRVHAVSPGTNHGTMSVAKEQGVPIHTVSPGTNHGATWVANKAPQSYPSASVYSCAIESRE